MSHRIKNTGTFPIILIITAIAENDRIRGKRQNTRKTTEYAENDRIRGKRRNRRNMTLQLINIIPQAIINY